MKTENGNSPAYPTFVPDGSRFQPGLIPGLTKRELIAAMALSGMLANSNVTANIDDSDYIPAQAARVADALLEELSK